MSHGSQLGFVGRVKAKLPAFFRECRVLEVGSYNVNGSVRQFFEGCDYVGLDVAPGQDVDVVGLGHQYVSDDSFDTVISCETMEHNLFWKETLQNMLKLLRRGGLMVTTCATTGRPEHGTKRSSPQDALCSALWEHYQNLTLEDYRRAIDMESFSEHCFEVSACDLYFYGIKS